MQKVVATNQKLKFVKSIYRLRAKLFFYPSFFWSILLARILNVRNWWDKVDEVIIIGARPLLGDISKLHEIGVRGIVNLCEEFSGHTKQYEKYGIEQCYLPTIDFSSPSLKHIFEAIAFIEPYAKRNERVYVHCKAGRARSATIVLCWLIANNSWAPGFALSYLLSKRSHVVPKIKHYSSVQQFIQSIG